MQCNISRKINHIKKESVDDKSYWENYYAKRKDPFEPSMFAQHVIKYLERGKRLIELGCGNGRDSVFFSKNGLIVTAVDQCTKEVEYLAGQYSDKNIRFTAGDFTNLSSDDSYDYIYSRFTLHSVNKVGENAVYDWIGDCISEGGYFFLEVRGRDNDLYGLGKKL